MRVRTAAPTARGLARGVVAAMVMTGLRQVTTGIGLVDQTPPDAILKQRAFGVLVRYPRVAYFVARRQVALVELAHWAYGAAAGAAFAQLPPALLKKEWAGLATGSPRHGPLSTTIAQCAKSERRPGGGCSRESSRDCSSLPAERGAATAALRAVGYPRAR
jgi:hypothetical protein